MCIRVDTQFIQLKSHRLNKINIKCSLRGSLLPPSPTLMLLSSSLPLSSRSVCSSTVIFIANPFEYVCSFMFNSKIRYPSSGPCVFKRFLARPCQIEAMFCRPPSFSFQCSILPSQWLVQKLKYDLFRRE